MSGYGHHPRVRVKDRVASVELLYPRVDDNCHTIQVGLEDVRAADEIRIHYDFDRDGWVVQQESGWEHDGWSESSGEWREVAFIQAWGLYKEAPKDG